MRFDILIGWLLLYAPVGLAVGAVIVFGALPLYHRLVKTPREKRSATLPARLALTGLIMVFFSVLMCALSIYGIESTKNDYWQSRGGWDSWRVPLVEPYELVMFKTMESAVIRAWQAREPLIGGIIRCRQQGPYVAGETGVSRSKNDKTVQGWFLCDCAAGTCVQYATRAAFDRGCAAAGLRFPLQLDSVRDVWYSYWKIIGH